MNNLFVLDELGEPLSEGDVAIYEGIGWIITKIEELRLPEIIDPKFAIGAQVRKRIMKVTLSTEFTTPVMVGGRLPKVFKSTKRMNPSGVKNPTDS